jgi:putative endonuclease
MKTTPKAYGEQSENLASQFLQQNGFTIIERNYFARKLGELDIIATKDEVLHFIEVKASQTSYDAIYNIRPAKIKKVINSAQYYMKAKGLDVVFSIDAIIIRGNDVEFIENVTM